MFGKTEQMDFGSQELGLEMSLASANAICNIVFTYLVPIWNYHTHPCTTEMSNCPYFIPLSME